MTHIVKKPFKTLNRKFAVGDKIAAEDVDPRSAFTLGDWVTRGFAEPVSNAAPFVASVTTRASRFAAPTAEPAAE